MMECLGGEEKVVMTLTRMDGQTTMLFTLEEIGILQIGNKRWIPIETHLETTMDQTVVTLQYLEK